jgi:hypothetical protein
MGRNPDEKGGGCFGDRKSFRLLRQAHRQWFYISKYATTSNANSMAFASLQRLLASNDQVDVGQRERENPLTLYAALYGIADKYECPSLKTTCEKLYVKALSENLSIPDFISSINVAVTWLCRHLYCAPKGDV